MDGNFCGGSKSHLWGVMWSDTAEPLKSSTIDSEIKPKITREISEFLSQKSLKNVIIEPTVYMTAVTHRNQEIGLEIKKSHYKSNRNRVRSQVRNHVIIFKILSQSTRSGSFAFFLWGIKEKNYQFLMRGCMCRPCFLRGANFIELINRRVWIIFRICFKFNTVSTIPTHIFYISCEVCSQSPFVLVVLLLCAIVNLYKCILIVM